MGLSFLALFKISFFPRGKFSWFWVGGRVALGGGVRQIPPPLIMDAPGQRHGQQPVSGTADPGVVKQDKSSRGSVGTTKTRSDPQRVRMSSGERPIGTANGKQPNTEALCHPPAPRPTRG